MKIPCEIVVWYVLPMIRREIANELVSTHSMSQAEVARRFGVTDAAISQYLKKKRGDNLMIEQSDKYPMFLDCIKRSSQLLAEDKSTFEAEICRLCSDVRRIGLLAEIYEMQVGEPMVTCDNFGTSACINEKE